MSWSNAELEALASLTTASGELAMELLALRKQTALDRQSREASQAEFARLNRQRNVAIADRDKWQGLAELLGEMTKTLCADKERLNRELNEAKETAQKLAVLLDEAYTALAASRRRERIMEPPEDD